MMFKIGDRLVGEAEPTYFIADISANHDGNLDRAKLLVHLAKESGADAAKFQHFRAAKIVSRAGFEALGKQIGHQAAWKQSVYEVYEQASLPWEWTSELASTCAHEGIEFLSTPYDLEAVDMLDPYVNAYKVGSGDINWIELVAKVASKGKPVILATGASTTDDVQRAVSAAEADAGGVGILQCNTNYTGARDNFDHLNLNVLRTLRVMYPNLVLGLSDHTPGHAAALGSIALGGRIVEKHFTDDVSREGPDHGFSMTPSTWRQMVERSRELEAGLGSPAKFVAANETESSIVQRRCLRAALDLPAGAILTRASIEVLRPAPAGSVPPNDIERIIGQRLFRPLRAGDHITWSHLDA